MEPPKPPDAPPAASELLEPNTKKQKGASSPFQPTRTLRSYKDSLVHPECDWNDHTMHDISIPSFEVDSDIEDDNDDQILVILLSKAEKERIQGP